jgi:hypothetical protein
MSANWIVAGVVLLVLGIGGLVLLTGPPREGPVFIAGNQAVTEDQVRQNRHFDLRSEIRAAI